MVDENRQNILRRRVIIIALAVLLMAFYLFQVATGFRLPFFSPVAPPGSVAEGSMQAAVQSCKSLIQSELGDRLQQMDADDRATRYDETDKVYRVFVDITVEGAEREDIYIECRVSSVSQDVLEFKINGPARQFNQIGL